jgi:hypothetical protein
MTHFKHFIIGALAGTVLGSAFIAGTLTERQRGSIILVGSNGCLSEPIVLSYNDEDSEDFAGCTTIQPYYIER